MRRKKKEPPSEGYCLFNAISWTFSTVLWTIAFTLNFRPETKLPYIQAAVILLSALNAVLNWRRWAVCRGNTP